MSAGKFWLLTFLSGVIAILVLLEIACEQQVSYLSTSLSVADSRIAQARQQNELLRQLVQRIIVLSQDDPSLSDLLTKRGLHLTRQPSASAAPAPLPTTAPATPIPHSSK